MKRPFSGFATFTLACAMATAAMAQSSNGIESQVRGYTNTPPVARFDNGYLDEHPEVAQQLGHDPRLADNPQFLATHPGLDSYLASHPEVRTELLQHPDRFMNRERHYERYENSRGYPAAAPVARFDNGYLDEHPDVAQQLAHDPRLADNPQFLATHPGLNSYLASHPEVRTELQHHPDRFMSAEAGYGRHEKSENWRARWKSHPLRKWWTRRSR